MTVLVYFIKYLGDHLSGKPGIVR